MEVIRVNICVKDRAYGQALKEALTRNYSGFIVTLNEKVEGEEPADVHLYDEGSGERKNGIWLTEKLSGANEEKLMFYKYDNIKNLAAKIILAYGKFTGRRLIVPGDKQIQLIAVAAAAGGLGASSVAMGIAQELKRFQGKSVLYLSLESFESTGNYLRIEKGKKGIFEYLYYLKSKKRHLCSCIEDFLVYDTYGIEGFGPAPGMNPLLKLKKEDFELLLEELMELGRYQVVVFDCGNNINDLIELVFQLSDFIVFLNEEGVRKEAYLRYLTHKTGEGIKERMITLTNKYVPYQEPISLDEGKGEDGKDGEEIVVPEQVIAYDEHGFHRVENHVSVCIDGDFGLGIKEIVKKLT
ncbi:MAG: hypothetical protein RR626_06175 [Anaerovoracaceae bacterium]